MAALSLLDYTTRCVPDALLFQPSQAAYQIPLLMDSEGLYMIESIVSRDHASNLGEVSAVTG